jgi:hypothetical protein
MPRIEDFTSKCVVYVYPNKAAAESDRGGGSGFITYMPVENVPGLVATHLYIATNAHNLAPKEGSPYPAPAVVARRHDGTRQPVVISASNWHRHPDGDDVALASVDLTLDVYDIAGFDVDSFVTAETIERFNIGIGEDVYYIGRFQPFPDRPSITAVRFGNISAMPVQVRHPRFNRDVESYLIEGRARKGFSGSPVIARLSGGRETEHSRPLIDLGWSDYLLGINWGHVGEWVGAKLQQGQVKIDPIEVEVNAGIMCVAPAWKIRDLLFVEEFVEHRKREEERLRQETDQSMNR